MAWTEERIDTLKRLWAEGLSASQIANRLGGVTRNAVIGKAHRLGLSGRATTSRKKPQRPRRRLAKNAAPREVRPSNPKGGKVTLAPCPAEAIEIMPDPAPVVPISLPEDLQPPTERHTILTLTDSMCRWPIGDPGEEGFHFCGRYAPPGQPYCEECAKLAYQPVRRRRDVKPMRRERRRRVA